MTGTKSSKKVVAAAVSVFMLTHVLPNKVAIAEYIVPSMPDFSYIGALGSLTADQTKKAAETVYDALYFHKDDVNFKSKGIKMTSGNSDQLISIYRHFAACYDVGILVRKGTISYIPSSSIINLSYLYSGSEYEGKYREYSGMLDDILSGVDQSWSDEEKALYLHDYISVRFDYDYPAYNGIVTRKNREQYSAYGMLKNGMAVCEGYSELYAKLMNRLGIRTELVTSDEMKHAWNRVDIDGNKYYVDVAWDDSFYGYSGIVKHTNFLRTAPEMRFENHDCTDWKDTFGNNIYSEYVPDTFSDAFWLKSRAAIKPYDEGWLVISGNPNELTAEMVKYDSEKHKAASKGILTDIPASLATWYVWGNPYSYWTESFTVTEVVNGMLYYSTPSAIYSYCNGQNVKVYELNDNEKKTGYIYGLYADGETLYYGLDTEYHHVGRNADVPIKYNGISVSVLEAKAKSEAGASEEEPEVTAAQTMTKAGLTVSTSAEANSAAPPQTYVTAASLTVQQSTGDVDYDGMINAVDASVILSYYAGLSTGKDRGFSAVQKQTADVNRDGVIDAVDASYILSFYAFLSTHTETLNMDEFIDKRRIR